MNIARFALALALTTASTVGQNSQPGYSPSPEMNLFPKRAAATPTVKGKPNGVGTTATSSAKPATGVRSNGEMRLFPSPGETHAAKASPADDRSELDRQIAATVKPELLQYMSPSTRAALKKAQEVRKAETPGMNLFPAPAPLTPEQKAAASVARTLSRPDVQEALKNQGRR